MAGLEILQPTLQQLARKYFVDYNALALKSSEEKVYIGNCE
jgi:hypothetical protein